MTTSNDHQRIANAFDAFVYVVQSLYKDRIAEATTAAHNGALGHAREVLEEYESISAIIANRLIAEFPDANDRERLMLDDASVAILLALVPAYRLAELVDAA